MEINEFKKVRLQLETDLAIAIYAILKDFKKKHGMTPKAIKVNMIDVTTVNSTGLFPFSVEGIYELSNVKTYFEI